MHSAERYRLTKAMRAEPAYRLGRKLTCLAGLFVLILLAAIARHDVDVAHAPAAHEAATRPVPAARAPEVHRKETFDARRAAARGNDVHRDIAGYAPPGQGAGPAP